MKLVGIKPRIRGISDLSEGSERGYSAAIHYRDYLNFGNFDGFSRFHEFIMIYPKLLNNW